MADSKTKNTAKHETIKDVPIGIDATGQRQEFDSMGAVEVPADRYWGAQTQRSLQHFSIGDDHMPKAVYHAYGYVKKAAALVNAKSDRLEQWRADAIIRAADEVIAGKLDEHFPLYVWQTGSGTQSNMNLNEVIANRAIQLLGGTLGTQTPIHPNDHVNMGQSSNDSFPTAMHIATVFALTEHMLPAAGPLRHRDRGQGEPMDGRGQNRPHPSAGRGAAHGRPRVVGLRRPGARRDARTCAGRWTGCTASRAAAPRSAPGSTLRTASRSTLPRVIAELTDKPFVTAPNKFAAQGSLDAMVAAMAAVRGCRGGADEDRQ